MSSEGKCFMRGLFRIIVAIAAIALTFTIFNVIGYLLVQTGYFYIQGNTYAIRAWKLAGLGFFNAALVVGAAAFSYYVLPKVSRWVFAVVTAILTTIYYAIAIIGGYREPEKKTDDI